MVNQHLNLVYSAALRVLGGNASEAEEVVQATFTELARKAGGLREKVILSGWLYQTAVHLAQRRLRTESRRRHREQEAVAMNAFGESDQEPWTALAPVLDEVMGRLNERERDALVLRYFEKQNHRSVGEALGLTDDGAQKCVSRALEKLRGLLQSRGIHNTASALSVVLLANSLQAAPESLAAKIPGRSLAGAALGAGGLARWKLALGAGLVAAGTAGPLLWQQEHARSRAEISQALPPAAPTAEPAKPVEPVPVSVTKASVVDLVAQAATALHGGAQHFTATTTALNLLAQISVAEIPAAVEEILKVEDLGAQTLLFKYVLGRWTETDPGRALQFAAERLPMACRAAGMEGLLDAWSGSNQGAGLLATSKSGTLSLGNNSLTTALYRNLASKNLPQAFDKLGELSSPGERAFALRGIMEKIISPADRQNALERIEQFTDATLKIQAKRSLVERWADQDAPAVAEWVLKMPSAYERLRMMDSLGLVWLQRDPETAANWWIEHAPGADTMTKIVNVWAHEDPNGAGQWLREHATGTDSDDARMTFARQVQELDPESAFAWAETISQPELRLATFDHLYRSWRLRDPVSAQQYLDQTATAWSAELKQRYSTPPPTNP